VLADEQNAMGRLDLYDLYDLLPVLFLCTTTLC